MAGPSDDRGWSPDGGSSDDLPDLPEEWGVIVIPDDLSELDDEVEAIRAELKLTETPTRWRRFADRPGLRTARRFGAGSAARPGPDHLAGRPGHRGQPLRLGLARSAPPARHPAHRGHHRQHRTTCSPHWS